MAHSLNSRGPSAARTPLEAGVEGLLRPLRFALEGDQGNLDRVQDLEVNAAAACRKLQDMSLPSDLVSFFKEVESLFTAPLEGGDRRKRLESIWKRLSPLREPEWIDGMLGRRTSVLPGVGGKRADSLAQRGIATVGDLLFHLPSRYEDRRRLSRVSELEVGRRATFIASVLAVDFVGSRARGHTRQILQAVVGDDGGTISLKWFRGGESIARNLKQGDRLLITGDIVRYRFSKEIVHPEVERLDDSPPESDSGEERPGPKGEEPESENVQHVVPLYTAPEKVNPRTLRRLIQSAVESHADLLVGWLPPRLAAQRGLPAAADAIRQVHCPGPGADVDAYSDQVSAAHERLILEELYLLEVGLALVRQARGFEPGFALNPQSETVQAVIHGLPFELTAAQQRVWSEIAGDLARPHPMHRLLQGDVGSGKTVVALLAAVAAQAAGKQAALMAPTELLAEQHARTLAKLVGDANLGSSLRMALLTASRSAQEIARIKGGLAEGKIDLVVGTHALVQEDVHFQGLGLAIIDEQHRFGVRQRAALAARGAGGLQPHSLLMTATPIPRTLALTVYGDLDVSVIDSLPPGRSPVETDLLREGEGGRIVGIIEETLARGEQVYVVYPLVEESEKVDLRSALESAERIRRAFPDARVGVLHGRLEAGERGRVMDAFGKGELDLLVATTVIEVGVDVPNATLMVIEHAERFGLAQLHQLRGRVGRGNLPGRCLLVARGGSEKGEARMRAMLDTTDGFVIADADLKIRGPGEFLGTRQSGQLQNLRIADLVRDARLVSVAREAALAVVRADPGLGKDPGLARAVAARWGDKLALVEVG
ncbi:MAG: ATP-dependent DNA helicase RecG [Myxococcota bacterium]|nr:ATP-dependent DNA helicase RecG [Myxococcota bacterium]